MLTGATAADPGAAGTVDIPVISAQKLQLPLAAPRLPEPRPPSSLPDRPAVLRTVWPIVLANASAPLLALADTAALGRTGTVAELGAVALGGLVLSFVYWGFGFLRMTTTGFVAQADGADDGKGARTAMARAILMGVLIGIPLLLMRSPIASVALSLLEGSPEIEEIASSYVRIRILGAPAALASFALIGTLIGLGASRSLLAVQVAINALNIALDVLFAGVMGLGASGVAVGTVIAEWVGLVIAGVAVWRLLRARWPGESFRIASHELLDLKEVRATISAQFDIMARTIFLLGGFAWFTNQGARFGDSTLAANHILLQLVSFSAFVLDGYAFATESLVGRAIGRGDRREFDHALRVTTELAFGSAIALGASVALFGSTFIGLLTTLPEVHQEASSHLGYAAIYIALSFGAFQLDGVFIGATRTRAMRNASLASVLLFLGFSWFLVPRGQNVGLWLAFIGYVVARAVCLGAALPGLRRSVRARTT